MSQSSQYSMTDLLYLMSRLRDPQTGCPWDLKQTPQKIINYSIEEIYELADAIEQTDFNNIKSTDIEDIKGELGDVLFQVIFLSRLADEEQQFTFNDVVHTLCSKLVSRHPHVFTNGKLYPNTTDGDQLASNPSIDEDQVAQNWEKIKASERAEKKRGGLFDDVPLALPALSRAAKLQKRASSIGFDWPDARGALDKLKEEVLELEELLDQAEQQHDLAEDTLENRQQRLNDELGDVLFSGINVARKIGVNSEQALRHANTKFVSRIDAVVEKMQQSLPEGVQRDQVTTANEKVDIDTLDKLWNAVKQEEKPS